MNKNSTARTRKFVSYKNALKKEKELGRTITLFDERLVKIKQKKDGTYIIEPILRLYGTDRNPNSYDNTLISRKGFLALEITNEEQKVFKESEIMRFSQVSGKSFNIYEKRTNYRSEYDLIDLDVLDKYQIRGLPIIKLTKKENSPFYTLVEIKGYSIQELKGMQAADKIKQPATYFYIDVTGLPLNEELKHKVIHISKTKDDYIKKEEFFLMPYVDLENKPIEFKREYALIIKNSIRVGYVMKKNGTLDIKVYNFFTKARLKLMGYNLGFICNSNLLKKVNSSQTISGEVLSELILVTKTLSTYEHQKTNKTF